MSTRCMIEVEGIGVKLYRHSDGYPEGVLPGLTEQVKRFTDARGWDAEYLLARIAQWQMNEYDAHGEEFRQTMGYKPEPSVIGYGLDTRYHGDLEYVYIVKQIDKKPAICCYSFNWNSEVPGDLISVTNV